MRHFKAHVLILDDNQDIRSSLNEILVAHGYMVSNFPKPSDAIQAIKRQAESGSIDSDLNFDVIVSDVRLPEMDGLEFIKQVKAIRSDVPIILMTAFGCLDIAIQAIRLGASDFLKKPFEGPELLWAIERAVGHSKLVMENQVLVAEIRDKWKLNHIAGRSKKMQEVFEIVKRVAKTSANVLITGESGSGKEVIARAIHENSLHANQPFVPVNCAAIPEELLESELFGHSKGSFTGADRARKGLFQEAEGGTLFLDEIGDMNLSLQAKLLRVLQDKKVKPVGENVYKQINVRIIAATHRDLQQAIREGKFREDLYYRLKVISLNIPPLREREDDIPLLCQHFIKKFAAIHHSPAKSLSKEAFTYLLTRQWPGNVRELENMIERAVIMCKSPDIQVSDLREEENTAKATVPLPSANPELLPLSEIEKQHIWYVLKKVGGKKEKAARVLKIDRTTLYRKLLSYGLGFPNRRQQAGAPQAPADMN